MKLLLANIISEVLNSPVQPPLRTIEEGNMEESEDKVY